MRPGAEAECVPLCGDVSSILCMDVCECKQNGPTVLDSLSHVFQCLLLNVRCVLKADYRSQLLNTSLFSHYTFNRTFLNAHFQNNTILHSLRFQIFPHCSISKMLITIQKHLIRTIRKFNKYV